MDVLSSIRDNGCYLHIAYGASDTSQADDGIRRLVKGLRAIDYWLATQ